MPPLFDRPRARLPAVAPYDPGVRNVVRPLDAPLHWADQEMDLHDAWAQEQVRNSGTPIHYYVLDVGRSDTNPVYDESTVRRYRGPFRMWGYVEWPKSNPEVHEEGLVVKWETRVWIPRKDFEDARCDVPLEGDVIQAWRTQFFDQWAVTGDEPQKGGYYFTVLNTNDEGHPFDSPGFVGFEMNVARSTEFTPERRIENRRP